MSKSVLPQFKHLARIVHPPKIPWFGGPVIPKPWNHPNPPFVPPWKRKDLVPDGIMVANFSSHSDLHEQYDSCEKYIRYAIVPEYTRQIALIYSKDTSNSFRQMLLDMVQRNVK